MIHLVKHAELDTEKWDDCIKKDANKLFYGLSWYLDILVKEWDALVWNDYEAVFPLISNKKFGINYVHRPYGVQQLGVFSKVDLSPELMREFVLAIPKNIKFVDVFLNTKNPTSLLNPKQLFVNKNYEINLNQTYQSIYEGYSKQTVRNLKKAKKHKHRIFEHDGPDQIIALFKNNKGKRISTLSEENYATMKQVMHVLLHKHRGYIWTIYDEHNTIIAGAFFVEMFGRITMLFSATDDVGREQQAMTYLLDELFIARATDQIIFDFEGSNIKNLATFYAGFGGQEVIYQNLKINNLPGPLKWLKG